MQDSTSKRSLFYYTFLIRLAKLCRTKIYIYANGIGPLNDPSRLYPVLRLADRISVRDPDSLLLAREICKNSTPIYLTADPVFTCPIKKSADDTLKKKHSVSMYFAVSLRQCAAGKINTERLERVIRAQKAKGLLPVFVSMQDSYDRDMCEKLARKTGGTVADINNIDELFCLLENASFAIGMRLHFLLCALMCETPTVALSYDTKVKSCVSYLGSPYILDAFSFSVSSALRAIDMAIRDLETVRRTKINCEKMRALADEDMDELTALACQSCGATAKKQRSREKFFADT